MMGLGKVLVIIDGPDPDNYILALAASSQLLDMDVVAVIMTGRPVSAVHGQPPYGFNPHASRAVRRDNALHVKGIFMRHGREHIPVFEGLRAPFSTVPHKFHIHERVTDVYDDAHAGHQLAGDIDDAVAYLAGLEGSIHVICGGPMTDLAYLMQQLLLSGKLGLVTAQLGMFGFGGVKTIAGGRRQFNALADPTAAHLVLQEYPGPFYLLPTDITKDPAHGFDHPDELAALLRSTAGTEVVEMYRAAWPIMWEPRGERIFVHDFHPAELMHHLLRQQAARHEQRQFGRYRVSPVGIAHVPHLVHEQDRWGEIDLGPPDPSMPPRFLVDGVDTSGHRIALATSIDSAPYPSEAHHGATTVAN
ncbi:MAG TPA: nucleoside hydrolase [Verrucomicrobiae bacterium]|nr:nucleoside hydrolase [Verrucomicrobiae bacterium]